MDNFDAIPAAPSPHTEPATASVPPPQTLRFHGKGSEYFGIWIVNILLTILTLGIYSAWAKVRRLQYFYRATELDGSSFDYHGKPMAILKGRIIALLLFGAYQASIKFFTTSPAVFPVVLVLMFAIGPWLIWNSFRFSLFNSSYRGLRFGFDGKVGGMYLVALSWVLPFFIIGVFAAIAVPLAKDHHLVAPAIVLGAVAAFGLPFVVLPYCHRRLKNYQHGNARFGATKFSFEATFGQFAGVYFLTFLVFLGSSVLMGILASVLGLTPHLDGFTPGAKPDVKAMTGIFVMLGFLYFGIFLISGPFFASRMQNLIWNNTRLGSHGIESNLGLRGLLGVYLLMFVGTALTLGFYYPWAIVRLMRYRIEHLTFVPSGSMDEFVAGQSADPGALGMEAASVFDIDISI